MSGDLQTAVVCLSYLPSRCSLTPPGGSLVDEQEEEKEEEEEEEEEEEVEVEVVVVMVMVMAMVEDTKRQRVLPLQNLRSLQGKSPVQKIQTVMCTVG